MTSTYTLANLAVLHIIIRVVVMTPRGEEVSRM